MHPRRHGLRQTQRTAAHAQVRGDAGMIPAIVVAHPQVGSEAGERRFLDELDKATLEAARKELAILLEAKRRDQPDATSLDSWDWRYYANRVAEQKYAIKAGEMRAYTAYAGVKDGVLQIASRMFNISFRPVKAPVWHPTVEVYDVLEKGTVIGRIYLDMFVRANKSPGAMTAPAPVAGAKQAVHKTVEWQIGDQCGQHGSGQAGNQQALCIHVDDPLLRLK